MSLKGKHIVALLILLIVFDATILALIFTRENSKALRFRTERKIKFLLEEMPHPIDSDSSHRDLPPSRYFGVDYLVEILENLEEIGEIGIPVLTEMATDTGLWKEEYRRKAVFALGRLRLLPNKSMFALQQALQDQHSDVRCEAIISLACFGKEAKPAIPALQRALLDKNPHVRKVAEGAIDKIQMF